MIVVQNGANYWLVDPQYSLVNGPYASLNAVSTIAVPEIMTSPNYYRYSSITRTEYSPNRQLWQAKRPGEPQPWHTDPAIRTRFGNVLRGISGTVNVDNYYPQQSVPVEEVDPNPSGLDAAAFFSR
ncbi:MAG: hypothetical protein JWP89_3002 [Schlesneria sp.]|nr:hypothetical protein [Schlesneria sp.]